MTATYTPEVAAARKIIAAELDGCYTDIDNAVRLLLADHARLAEENAKLKDRVTNRDAALVVQSGQHATAIAALRCDLEKAEARIKELEVERDSWKDDDLNGRVAYDTLREERDWRKRAMEIIDKLTIRAESAEARAEKVMEQTKNLEEFRKRWEIGFRNIVSRTIGPSAPFEINQVVNLVEAAWKQRAALRAAGE